MNIVKTEHLTYVYGGGTPFEKTAVDDINIEIEEGSFIGVIGHTGSGKSTLISHFNGLLKPTSGEVYIDGENIWKDKQTRKAARRKVGLVFQYPEYQLFEETVYKDVAFGPKNIGMTEDEIDTAVRTACKFVGLAEDLLEKSPFELSGGEKRRAAIAGVLAMQPKVLILDEPTAGLDPRGRDEILSQIKDYHGQQGNTVIIVSHSMEDVARFAKQVLVMNQSKVYLYDKTDAVFSHAAALSGMGLDIPQVSDVFLRLAGMGLPVNPNVYTVAAAKAELLRALGERGKAQ